MHRSRHSGIQAHSDDTSTHALLEHDHEDLRHGDRSSTSAIYHTGMSDAYQSNTSYASAGVASQRTDVPTVSELNALEAAEMPFFQRRRAVLLVISLSLLLDYCLLMIIVPIIPHYLKELHVSSIMIGVLFASKGMMQILANPFWGRVVDKLGPVPPLTMGLLVLIGSTLVYAVGKSYGVLIVARSVQGIGSAAIMTAGMSYISHVYPKAMRGEAMGSAMSGVGLGVMVGPALGGLAFVHSPFGRALPFLLVAVVVGVALFLLVCVVRARSKAGDSEDLMTRMLGTLPSAFSPGQLYGSGSGSGDSSSNSSNAKPNSYDAARDNHLPYAIDSDEEVNKDAEPEAVPISVLIRDPQILSLAVGMVIADSSISMIEPLLPTYFRDEYGVSEGLTGVLFLCVSVAYSITSPLVGRWSENWNRRVSMMCGMVVIAVALPFLALAPNLPLECLALGVMGAGMGTVDASALPRLSMLVDERYPNSYGAVFALGDIALSIGYVIGPLLGTGLKHLLSLSAALLIYSAITLSYLPVLWLTRPSTRQVKLQVITDPDAHMPAF